MWAIERAPALTIDVQSDGRIRVGLDASAAKPCWCLGPVKDVRLRPGATVVLQEHGELGGYLGAIELAPAPSGRPALTPSPTPR